MSAEHETTVEVYKNHRPGVDFYRPTCSCGWYTRGIMRHRQNAEDICTAHRNREGEPDGTN